MSQMSSTQHTQPPILEVKNLETSFKTRHGWFKAVDDVSISLYPGRTLCVVGESGSGKSVMSRSILQIVDAPGKITGGEILLHTDFGDGAGHSTVNMIGMDPRGKQVRAIRGDDIAMIFQEPMSSLSPVHRIGDQIGETLRIHMGMSKKEAIARSVELLRMVEIPNPEEAVKRYPYEFSGGMRQRAMIAMALSCNPKVLIADEPTTALDVTIQAEILELMRSLQKAHNMAILFITHDMGVVAEIADDVAVMRHGKVVEKGDVYSVFASPQHDYTKSLLHAATQCEGPSDRRLAMRERRPLGDPILEAVALRKEYVITPAGFRREAKTLLAVKDANLQLRDGENIGIVGESGSGKTTLARCIQRIHSVSSGAVLYTDRQGNTRDLAPLTKPDLKEPWRDMRIIFQDPFGSLNPRMTVGQIIAEPLMNHGLGTPVEQRARVAELLDLVGLPGSAAERYPHAFSGGQRQRISIARAIAPNPRIIIADEATSALDVSLRTQIMDLLLELQEKLGLSYLFISHDVGLVRYFCDRVVVMYKGQIMEEGETEDVCTNPQHPYTQSLLSAVPIADPTMRASKTRTRYVEG
ncbi:ABC transporter ATP-binding protein [uncultured Litoreibacter sp.]|uniref:ABC transporter ATP-binding protein n=1 Tax=uncultured Litoreibacter sp. TaxID=1392394 RepID=UPI00262D33A3|nr:ABC transporter ATP-binding protein [uncultured Litoreibacter sp.]